MATVVELRDELERAARTKDRAERQLALAVVIAECLRPLGYEPVLVGGAAVEIYTHGGYSTDDLDLLAPSGPDVEAALEAIGFKRTGKDFVHEPLGLYVEFPGDALGPTERSVFVAVGARRVRLVSREDLVVDRLCAFKFWKSALDGLNAILLLEDGSLDEAHLESRAKEEDVDDALRAVRQVAERIIRQKLSKRRANAAIERAMRALPR